MKNILVVVPRCFRQYRIMVASGYWIELATEEKALLAFEPTSRIVPTTRTKITASTTAYSAMS